jgi:metal-responsive CopG/Arc/MetJ family transcriptional regulator
MATLKLNLGVNSPVNLFRKITFIAKKRGYNSRTQYVNIILQNHIQKYEEKNGVINDADIDNQ